MDEARESETSALDPDIASAIASLSAGPQALQIRLLGRYPAGEFGAYRVEGDSGRHFALKIAGETRVRNAARTTERLRSLGYPAPEYLQIGPLPSGKWCALLSEEPGEHVANVDDDLLRKLLTKIDMQADNALLPEEPESILQTLLVGNGRGWCHHAAMRTYSEETSSLLDTVISIGRSNVGTELPSTDIVHFDFHLKNILVLDGQVSGIVDWEGTRSGDRSFDIATLLFYTYKQSQPADLLWTSLLGLAGPKRAAMYLAHMVLRQVAYSVEFQDTETVGHYVETSQGLIADLKSSV